MKKISIIIPVYNGEAYIEKCISSVLNQTYNNIEVIVVNDGSTDETEKILKKYNNKNLIVINKKNTGVSDSRNVGIKKASGDYIVFVDSDDWLEKNAVEVIVKNIGTADVLRFSHFVVNDTTKNKKSGVDDVYSDIDLKLVDNREVLSNLISNKTEGHLWNYAFKSTVIKENNIFFDESLFYLEDVLFLIKVISVVKKINVISIPIYNYYLNVNSVTKAKKSMVRNLSSIWLVRKKMVEFLEKNDLCEYLSILEQRFLNLKLMYLLKFDNMFTKKEFFDGVRIIAKENKFYYDELLKGNILNIKWKILILLLKNGRMYLLRSYIKVYKFIKGDGMNE